MFEGEGPGGAFSSWRLYERCCSLLGYVDRDKFVEVEFVVQGIPWNLADLDNLMVVLSTFMGIIVPFAYFR